MKIDCRGLACPAPVLKAKDAIENQAPELLEVTVDNKAAQENVTRFLKSKGYEVSLSGEGSLFHITGKSEGKPGSGPERTPDEKASENRIMVMLSSDCMGRGDDELGSKLMINFLRTLKEMGQELWRLVFVNSGVKLAIEGSEVLPELQDYEKNGLHILVCGTCLGHFDLLEKKKVGETTNMLDIVTAMQIADKVINL